MASCLREDLRKQKRRYLRPGYSNVRPHRRYPRLSAWGCRRSGGRRSWSLGSSPVTAGPRNGNNLSVKIGTADKQTPNGSLINLRGTMPNLVRAIFRHIEKGTHSGNQSRKEQVLMAGSWHVIQHRSTNWSHIDRHVLQNTI